MLFRNCAGGVVFYEDQVYLLCNEKDEWVLPKGVIRGNALSHSTALNRVADEAGIEAEILSTAGETNYEFFSITRRQPVCNRVTWYIMRAVSGRTRLAFEQGFRDGGYFSIEEALQKITYSQDRSLVKLAYEKYKEMNA